ncbi:MAG: phytanoyl-CoA dioxygenase family protein [Pirellulales bacterium]|nr:phytanoyl-CoA dioxygenase family protein [Pirellulales bacterium]
MIDIDELSVQYHRDGCIRVRSFLQPDLLNQVRSALDRYVRDVVPGIPIGDRTFESDGRTIRNLWRMETHDPYFMTLAERPDICGLIGALVHGEPVLMAVETFSKPPKVGSGVPPHQDNAYFCQTPPDVLTVWIAMDAATFENGTVYYLKGSHHGGVLTHFPSGVAGNSMGLEKMPAHMSEDEFSGTLEAGDALIHHCQTIHWSGPNNTDMPRRGLLLVYRGAHTESDLRLKANYEAARPKAV